MSLRIMTSSIFSLIFCLLLPGFIYSKLYWIEPRLPLQGEIPAKGTPWPLPREWKHNNQVYQLKPDEFEFYTNAKDCDVINKALDDYRYIIFNHNNNNNNNNNNNDRHTSGHTNAAQLDLNQRLSRNYLEKSSIIPELCLNSLNITVHDLTCGYPSPDNDEEYKLTINSTTGLLQSNTIWGALRGLETFSQLIYGGTRQCHNNRTNDHTNDHKNDHNNNNHNSNNYYYYINATCIHDYPEYNYRSIMLDTARHFIPKNILLKNLDAMGHNKFNVFHWHITDDQSFPLLLDNMPELANNGAFRSDYIYTIKDVNDIIDYARLWGIRVIPEIDTPGHTFSMKASHPEIITTCYTNNKPNVPNYPHYSSGEVLNPITNNTYNFLKQLYGQLFKTFKDPFIHLGMDEVWYDCWKSNPDIQKFMADHNMTTMSELEQYYVRNTINLVEDIGYKYLLWQDPIDNGVKIAPDSIVEVWKDRSLDSNLLEWQHYIKQVAIKGYKIVLSACWYLNYISYPYPGNDWEKFYACNPRNFSGLKAEHDLVIGGEACLWSEFVDSTNLMSRLWPRASAVAERLWSNPKNNDINSVRHRLDQQRCRLLNRGIDAAPILNGYCEDAIPNAKSRYELHRFN